MPATSAAALSRGRRVRRAAPAARTVRAAVWRRAAPLSPRPGSGRVAAISCDGFSVNQASRQKQARRAREDQDHGRAGELVQCLRRNRMTSTMITMITIAPKPGRVRLEEGTACRCSYSPDSPATRAPRPPGARPRKPVSSVRGWERERACGCPRWLRIVTGLRAGRGMACVRGAAGLRRDGHAWAGGLVAADGAGGGDAGHGGGPGCRVGRPGCPASGRGVAGRLFPARPGRGRARWRGGRWSRWWR